MYPFESPGSNLQREKEESLPYSTLGLRALQSCVDSGLQPCATYGAELLDSFRSKVNEGLHRSFSRIKIDDFCLRMDVAADAVGSYGWLPETSSQDYLVPDTEWEPEYRETEKDDAFVSKTTHEDVMQHMMSNGDRIKQLSNAVIFMEQTKLNA